MQIERLGPYRLLKELGRGGMGTVYSAIDEKTENPAAIKILAPQLAVHPGFRERFESEIDSLKKLEHPNIVRLFGYGQDGNYLYFAMELVDGTSIEQELADGRRFSWRETCEIGIDLCRALKLAHDHGIIHRDIKPANLLLTTADQVKLTDFGIARLFGTEGLTADGGVVGTAEFMAPEQADGRRATQQSDLYSLGGVMYALLAGRPPFQSKSMLEMLQMQRFSQPEPVRRFASDTPAEMERIIMQLLEKEPKDRFPNALMVGRRLEAMLHGLSIRDEHDEPGDAPVSTDLAPHDADSASSLKPAHGDSSRTDEDDFIYGRPTVGTDEIPENRYGATVDSADSAEPDDKTHAPQPNKRDVDATTSEPQPARADVKDATEPLRRFTTIEEERQREAAAARAPVISGATIFLIIALIATAAIIWRALQPPSADSLYEAIEAAAADEDEQELLTVEDKIAQFLQTYPNDLRADEVGRLQRRVDALLLDRRANLQARLLSKRYPDSPIAPEFMAAMRLAETGPEQAVIQLQSLIDLFDDEENFGDPEIRKFVEVARQQLPRLQEKVRRRASRKIALIEQRLDQARNIAASDPQAAREICQAIVTLYQDRVWAEKVVDDARTTLTELEKTAAALR